MELVAALTMQQNPRMQLSVAMLEPMCYDLGLENWWKSVKAMTVSQIRATIVKLIHITKR